MNRCLVHSQLLSALRPLLRAREKMTHSFRRRSISDGSVAQLVICLDKILIRALPSKRLDAENNQLIYSRALSGVVLTVFTLVGCPLSTSPAATVDEVERAVAKDGEKTVAKKVAVKQAIAKRKFTKLALDVTWESPIVRVEGEGDAPRVTQKRGGRIRTGQPLRVVVNVPPKNRPLSDVVLTLDEAQCSTRKSDVSGEDDGHHFVSLCGVDIDRDPGHAMLQLTATLGGEDPPSDATFKREERLLVVAGTYDERSLQVKKKFVQPPAKRMRRIERERETIATALASRSVDVLWPQAFTRPVSTKMTSPFGTLRTYNDHSKSRHLGLDLDGKTGDAIMAIASGRVVMVEERYFSGGTVVIDHGQTLFSLYFHMSRFDVVPGQKVAAGDVIGAVGKSGRVTGPHLHLSVKVGGHYVDPTTLLEFTETKPAPIAAGPAVTSSSSH